ncbi:hypothetical protein [Cytophaga sp. FL35]|uniref:FKBP-type peptidyl-prolyl cis-trans isomerase n=1 Tax=Cytophaga sp. FL35 TaxID=1904456 RepID=UPI00336A9C38
MPKDQLPENIDPQVGMALVSEGPNGQKINLVVKDVKDSSIVVDGNHPLAGQDLVFDLELVEIL